MKQLNYYLQDRNHKPKTASASQDWRMRNLILMGGKKMWQIQRPTAVDGCTRETIGKSTKSRIGVHHSKCFLLERRRLVTVRWWHFLGSGCRGQRLTFKNCRTSQDWVARVRSSLDRDPWLYGTSVQCSAALKKTTDTLEITRNGENPKKHKQGLP